MDYELRFEGELEHERYESARDDFAKLLPNEVTRQLALDLLRKKYDWLHKEWGNQSEHTINQLTAADETKVFPFKESEFRKNRGGGPVDDARDWVMLKKAFEKYDKNGNESGFKRFLLREAIVGVQNQRHMWDVLSGWATNADGTQDINHTAAFANENFNLGKLANNYKAAALLFNKEK
jgi:hypothetical protein